jgi:hypothetical protein
MPSELDVRRLLHLLAAYPVLPPGEALPPNDAALQSLVADLARAEASDHAGLLREYGHDLAIPVAELARRAQFLLACLLLPPAGTHYEVLGLTADASTAEVRKRWAALIQRYHPDHFGGAPGGGWLDGQARRLIEAYQVLKDPARREAYDAELLRRRAGLEPRRILATATRPDPRWRPPLVGSWRWAPVGILALGVAAGLWVYGRPAPLPPARLPAPPRLLDRPPVPEAWPRPPATRDAAPRETGPREARRPDVRPKAPPELPSLAARLAEPPPAGGGRAPAGRAAPPAAEAGPPPPAAAAVAAVPAPPPARAPAGAGAARTAPPREEALGLIEAFRAAYEQRNVGRLMALFGAAPRDRQVAGRPAVEALYTRNFSALAEIRYELDQLELNGRDAGESVVVEGRYRIRATRSGFLGDTLDVTGPIRWVLGREPGGLRILEIDYEMPPR